MLQFVIKNPLILNILNNTEKPSNLDGLSATLIDLLNDSSQPKIKRTENMKLLMGIFKELIASEYMFCNSHNNDCFVFLRERSRIAARMTGDFTISLCQKLGFNWLHEWCAKFYKFGAKEEKNVKKISAEANTILDMIFSQKFVDDIPIEIRYIVKLIFDLSQQFNFDNYRYMLTGNLLILRMICPFISVPEFYHIVPDDMGAPAAPARKCLTLVGKILSNLANNSFSVQAGGQKFELDEQLVPYSNIIYSNGDRYRDWIDRIMRANFDQFQTSKDQTQNNSNKQQQEKEENSFVEQDSDSEGFVPVQLQKIQQLEQVQQVMQMQNGLDNENDAKIFSQLKITEDMSPSEIIHAFLAQMFPLYDASIIKENQLSLKDSKIKLRYLSALHNSMINQKHAIYDLIQSMTHHDHDYISWFEQAAQEEKFKRFVEVYDKYYSQPPERDQLIRYFNMLIIALQAAPPILVELDYRPFDKTKAISKVYNITYSFEDINLKQVQCQLKITKCQLFFLQGKAAKINIQGNKINLIKSQKSNCMIGLSFKDNNDEYQYLEMLLPDEQSWQQTISSLFEMCYNKQNVSSEQFDLSDGNKVIVGNDSVFTWNGSKIQEEVYIIGLQCQGSGNSFSVTGKDGKSLQLNISGGRGSEFETKVQQLKQVFGD